MFHPWWLGGTPMATPPASFPARLGRACPGREAAAGDGPQGEISGVPCISRINMCIYILYLYIEKYICVFLFFFFFFFFFRAIGMVCENLCETNSEHRRPSVQELLVAEL